MVARIKALYAEFCLESKIRHSTMSVMMSLGRAPFCLESKIRHSTIVPTLMP